MFSKYSVKRPYTVLVGVVLVLILGYVSFTSMRTDLLPEMTLPYAIVYTTYPGASPEEVETMVTRPVEQSMATISNIESISSVSSENISAVILEFAQSANMDAVTIDMREKLDQIEGYWDDAVGSPIIMKLNPDMLPVMVAALEAGDLSQSDLTDLVNNEILPELESIEGVASVTATGTIEEQVQVTVREDKVREVNRKIRRALEKKFEEAESEIEENKEKLEDGKEQLAQGQEELANQTGNAQGQLNAGSSQIVSGQMELDSKLAEVDAGLAKLDASEQELAAQEKQLLEGEQALAALPEQKAALEKTQEEIKNGIALLEAAPATLAQLDAGIASLEEMLAQLEQMPSGGTPDIPQIPQIPGQTENGGGDLIVEDETTAQTESNAPVQTEPDAPAEPEAMQPETLGLMENEPELVQSAAEQPLETIEETETELAAIEAVDVSGVPTAEEMAALLADTDAGNITAIAELQAQLAALYQKKAELLTMLAALGVNTGLQGDALNESIDTAKATLVAREVQVADGIATIQKNIDDTPNQMATIAAGKKAITDGKKQIASGRKQLKAAKKQLVDAKQKVASGQTSLSSAMAELNKAQISATIEMAVGKAELSAGEKELEAAIRQVEEQKDAALDQADVTKIITTEMIKGILAAQNFTMPAGYVTEDGIDFLVRVGNKLETTEDIEHLTLLDMHLDDVEPVKLSDVADVVILDNSDEVYAKINGHAGVMFSMQKQSGYSTGEVSERIKKKFAQLEAANADVHFVQMMDQGIYIDLVVDSVLQNMLSGAALAILVLLIFLKSLRPTLVIACSIPISIMAAVVMMYFSNITLNIISLSGLALGIGMLVDNSIVVIENIYRLRNEGYPVKKAAVEGASQVAGAIAASTLTTVCVFAPIVFTEGITRQLFVDMGLTIAYSLLASLIVALTLVPAMGAGLLKNTKEKRSRIFEGIQNVYAKLLGWSLKVKLLVVLLAIGLLGYSGYLAISKGTAFMPEMESTQVSVTLKMPEGSQMAESAKITDEAMARIGAIADVADVGAMMGGSGMMSMMGGSGGAADTEEVSMYVLLNEDKTITGEELEQEILKNTADLDCEVLVETSTMDMSALGGSGISVQIKGRELDELKKQASEVAAILEGVEGTKNVSDGIEEKTLELRLVVDKEKAMGYQLTTAQVFQFLQGRLADATKATTLATLSKDYSVLVVSDTDETLTREKIKKLKMTGKDKDGKEVDVPLTRLVEFVDTEGFSSINREAQSRYVNVTAEIADGYNIGLVSADVEKALAEYEVPKGYSVSMKGEDETINEAMGQVGKMMLLAVAFMYLIMVAQFQSLLSPFIIIFTIPLAFTGGFFALYLTDSPVSVIALIGFVMLSGIIVNNGIVLVDYVNQLRREGMEKRAALIEAGRTRLRPIIMTALTTILGLCTMAMGMGMGADMVQPMAIVTIGGLTYGTLLTLFVIPCIYDLLNRKKDMREEEI